MRLTTLLALLLLAPAFAGCATSFSNSADGQSASGGGEGTFSKAGNHGMASKTERVAWKNPGAKASGTVMTNVGSGSLKLEMLDDAGKTVWAESFSRVGQTSRSFTTGAGEAGTWTLVVTVSGFSGQYAVEGRTT